MLFGQHLIDSAPPEWRYNYVDYNVLKNFLKNNKDTWTGETEIRFGEMLEAELRKVSEFGLVKYKELESRLQFVESHFSIVDDPVTSSKNTDLKTECDQVAEYIAQLSKYNSINYTALVRLLQKHDKAATSSARHTFMARIAANPFYKVSFDSLIARLSTLYGRLTPRLVPVNKEGNGILEKVDTYWVHPDNVTAVKLYVLQHLPVVVATNTNNNEGEGEGGEGSKTSCIYFDTAECQLYHDRVENHDTALSLRLRWYGSKPQTLLVDTRSHTEDVWSGEATITDSFPIKEKYVNAFLNGDWSFESKVDKMRAKGMSDMKISELLVLSKKVQDWVLNHRLKPCVRTSYRRISFIQDAGSKVRVDFDTDITMMLEEGKGSDNWYRKDAGTSNPPNNEHLPVDELKSFPYVVVTVTTRMCSTEHVPQWLGHMVDSQMVEPVPKFSKFAHACTLLLEKKLRLLPYWLPQLEKDLRLSEGEPLMQGLAKAPAVAYQPYHSMQPGLYADRRMSHERGNHLDQTANDLRRRKNKNVKALKDLKKSNEETGNQNRSAVAVYANPKIHMANERTFLHWIHTATMMATIALALMNLEVTGPSSLTSRIAGLSLLPVSILILAYSLYLYLWRDMLICRKDPGPYYSTVGPMALVGLFVLVVVVNYIVWFMQHGLNPIHWTNPE